MAEYGTAIIKPKIGDYIFISYVKTYFEHLLCSVQLTENLPKIGLPTFQIFDINNEKTKRIFQEK